MSSQRPFLVLARVGDDSLHPNWLADDRNFDLAIDYYGDENGKHQDSCDFYHASKGGKWGGLTRLFHENPIYANGYEAVWMPDDDILTSASTISSMFELQQEIAVGLAQPALTQDSYFSHAITLEHRNFSLRVTNFVEVMAPVFTRSALHLCLPTFSESVSGWGLDGAWQAILEAEGVRSAIFDCLPVRHTRPVGGGDLYRRLQVDVNHEWNRLSAKYRISARYPFRVLEGLDENFGYVGSDSVSSRILAAPPSSSVQNVLPTDDYLPMVMSSHRLARFGEVKIPSFRRS